MQKARGHIAAPTACRRTVSGSIALRYLRFFSPFLHSTGSLSVSREYLALPDGAGRFRQDFTGPALLRILNTHDMLHVRDFHPLWWHFPKPSTCNHALQSVLQPPRVNTQVWALPRSLATTYGIIIIFSSSPYLDVSVQEV